MFVADTVLKSENLDTFNFNLGRNNKVTWGCAYVLSHFGPVQIFAPTVDCSPPGTSVPGIPQARILEWVAMPSSTSATWEALVCAKLLQSCLTLSNPMDHSPPDSYVRGILQV